MARTPRARSQVTEPDASPDREAQTKCRAIEPEVLAVDLAEATSKYAQAKAQFQPKAQEILSSLLESAESLVRDGQSKIVGGSTRAGPKVLKIPLEPKDVAALMRELKPLAVGDEKGIQPPSGLNLNLNLAPKDVGALVLALRQDVEKRRSEAEQALIKRLPDKARGSGPPDGQSHTGAARERCIHDKVSA